MNWTSGVNLMEWICKVKMKKAKLEEQLKFTTREEMLKWFQRSKEKEIMEGDNNTKYYHAKANCRRRKNIIYSL